MSFNLLAVGMSMGALIALIICGVAVLAFAILGTVLRSRDIAKSKAAKKQASRAKGGKSSDKKDGKHGEAAPVAVEKQYDYTNLTEEEKKLIRIYRDGPK